MHWLIENWQLIAGLFCAAGFTIGWMAETMLPWDEGVRRGVGFTLFGVGILMALIGASSLD